MPSFSRARPEMRCRRAACAISMSDGTDGMLDPRGWKPRLWKMPARASLDSGQAATIGGKGGPSMQHKLKWIAAIVCVAIALAAHAQAPGVGPRSVLFGQSAPLTGSNAELGNDIRNGALAYFRKVNEAGGLHGRKLELVSLDDANQVPRAEANTAKLIQEERVFALFGYASATLSRPALPLVEKHQVPFLAPFTGADPMRVFNRYVYNMRASYADELEKIVEHFAPLGVKRFSIVYYDDVVGRENFSAVDRA